MPLLMHTLSRWHNFKFFCCSWTTSAFKSTLPFHWLHMQWKSCQEHNILPGEVRNRHCPVIGSYSWFSSEHRHRKEPSTFSQRASPHTPLSISHSFTSGEKKIQNINQFRLISDTLLFLLLYWGQYCLPDYKRDLWRKIKNSVIPKRI